MTEITQNQDEAIAARAGFRQRLGAFLIDTVIVSVIASILIFPATLIFSDYILRLPVSIITFSNCNNITRPEQLPDYYTAHLQQTADMIGVSTLDVRGRSCTQTALFQSWTVISVNLYRDVDGQSQPYFVSQLTTDRYGNSKKFISTTGALFTVLPFYFAFMQIAPRNDTYGKRFMKIKYVRRGGEPRFWRTFLRYSILLSTFPWIGFITVTSISFLSTGSFWATMQAEMALLVLAILAATVYFLILHPFIGRKKTRLMFQDKLFKTEVVRSTP